MDYVPRWLLGQAVFRRYLSRLSLSHSIYIGFAVVLMLLGMVAVMGVAGLGVAARSFTTYEQAANNALTVSVIDRTVMGMLSNVFRYSNGDERALPRVREAQRDIGVMLDKALENASDDEQRATIQRMTALVEPYVANLDRLIDLKQRRDHIIHGVMLPLGRDAQQRLNHIATTSMLIEDYKGAALAGRAQEALMATLLNSTLFLVKSDQSLVDEARQNVDAFVVATELLANYIIDPTLVDESYEAGRAGPKGRDAFLEVVAAIDETHQLVNDVMAGQGAEIAQLAKETEERLRRDLEVTNTTTSDTIDTTQLWALILTVVAGVVGSFQSWRVASHIVSRTDEIQRANAELEAVRQRMVDAIESISEGFVLWDSDDRMVLCNSRYREIYEAIGTMLQPGVAFGEVAIAAAERQHPVPADQRSQWVAERLELHSHPGKPHEQHMNDGRIVLVSERRTSEGGIVGVRTDITALKAMEAQLLQSSKLATLGEMATGIAHEINQPLTIMRMAAEKGVKFLERGGPEHLPTVLEKLKRIMEQVDRARAITDHMRTFGRKAPEGSERMDLKTVVDSALGFIGEQLGQRRITVKVDVDAVGTVNGNQIQLEQVLMNLLTNARDAIEARAANVGPTHPRIINVRVGVDGETNQAFLSVADTGGGIDSSVISRIFDPFFTTKEVGKGTGLGLSISYGIINNMGGTIRAENAGEGALFTLCLPLRDAKEKSNG
ncbi:MAG: PAS-domain containing protein [Rhodospirillaceae bacterium]|nr:PAS-domain containing protein [Rhodospirillales bacterium]